MLLVGRKRIQSIKRRQQQLLIWLIDKQKSSWSALVILKSSWKIVFPQHLFGLIFVDEIVVYKNPCWDRMCWTKFIIYCVVTSDKKEQITLNLSKNVICLGLVGYSFILAYSSITIEANSTNGFLTIFQMIKELNKEPVICINGLWL